MSIYITQYEFALPVGRGKTSITNIGMTAMAIIHVQAVPGFIGHPANGYDSDPYPWLPPCPPESEMNEKFRAVYFIAKGDNHKKGQQYDRPLLALTHDEYVNITYLDLISQLTEELQERWEDDELDSKGIFYID